MVRSIAYAIAIACTLVAGASRAQEPTLEERVGALESRLAQIAKDLDLIKVQPQQPRVMPDGIRPSMLQDAPVFHEKLPGVSPRHLPRPSN